MKSINLAFIGGTGFYDIQNLKSVDQISVETPFGNPSGLISLVEVGDQVVAFLPRHGTGHNLSPSNLPTRANIYALKTLGVERLISIGGTMVVIEGPAFSTSAESRLYQKWGGHIIGMTALPEAKLAREAEICYASLSLVTDNDSWEESDHVSQEKVASHLSSNMINGQSIVKNLIPKLISPRTCECQNALANTIITKADSVDPAEYKRLKSIISKYVQSYS